MANLWQNEAVSRDSGILELQMEASEFALTHEAIFLSKVCVKYLLQQRLRINCPINDGWHWNSRALAAAHIFGVSLSLRTLAGHLVPESAYKNVSSPSVSRWEDFY